MRKPVLPRILGLLVLYCAVFIVLVMIQFTKKGNFTRRIGGMAISGQYMLSNESREKAASENDPDSSEEFFYLAGGASVYFGGLEFILRYSDTYEFVLIAPDEQRIAALAERMSISNDTVNFFLSGGTELVFQTQSVDGKPELWISGQFPPGTLGIDIPVKIQRKSLIRETGEGYTNITQDGSTYQFDRSIQLGDKTVLSLHTGAASVSYRVIPERKVFNPIDYISANARNRQAYDDVITRWKNQKFSYWGGIVSAQADDDTVSAYCSEAVSRGNYREALALAVPAFLANSQRGYFSSVFTGGMEYAQRVFLQTERDKINRISRMISEKSPDILIENHAFEFLFIRGYLNNAEDGLELIRSMYPALLTYDMCPGIFEGYTDIRQFRPNSDNPFERLTDQACNIFSDNIRKEKDQVFVFRGNTVDIEYNLRLGKALSTWAGLTGRDDWAGLGHSLILSVLSLQDNSGAVPAFAELSESGEFSYTAGSRLSAARIYGIICPGEYYPRAVLIGSGVNGLWAWTAASAVNAAQESNVLDISASFPAGETHHMMIRGIRPFSKIQIYNMDYPSDSQFERYDSSGWVYSAQDQILTIKLKHREPVERIRIYYGNL